MTPPKRARDGHSSNASTGASRAYKRQRRTSHPQHLRQLQPHGIAGSGRPIRQDEKRFGTTSGNDSNTPQHSRTGAPSTGRLQHWNNCAPRQHHHCHQSQSRGTVGKGRRLDRKDGTDLCSSPSHGDPDTQRPSTTNAASKCQQQRRHSPYSR
jgi:hypothetical protein